MKKSKIILLGATFLVTLGLSFTSSTQAASTDQDNMNTLITSGDVLNRLAVLLRISYTIT